jgi:sugar lactone lactonase YvrE
MAASATFLCAPVASAAPTCAQAPHKHTILSGQGTLESVIVDPQGRLFFTATPAGGSGRVERVDRPGAAPRVLASGISSPGGMVFDGAGDLLVGFGDGVATGALGNLFPQAGLERLNPDTGAMRPYVTGLAMANGVARGPDGTIYASDDAGIGIDRVRGRTVQNRWATVLSSNGLVVDSSGRYLYAAQTFQPAAIKRIDIAHPSRVTTFARPPLADIAAGPDGMTRDADDNLYVAANGYGQIWRVDTRGRVCVLARGVQNASAVAFGEGTEGFRAHNLYAVGFGGELVALPHADSARYP